MKHRIAEGVKKVLIVTHVSGFVPQFEMNNVHILQSMGYEVHYASNYNNVSYGTDNHRLDGTGIIRHQIDFARSPFQIRENVRSYRQLRQLLRDQHFDLVHCHTPVGAALARLAAKPYRKQGTKVIYTAHGFHFYKGAPLKYWLLFYPTERFLANFTDVLVTINAEDYKRASRFCRHKGTRVVYIPGVGVDTAYYSGKDLPEEMWKSVRQMMRKKLNVAESEVVFLSVGELIPRKNHKLVIQAFAELESAKQLPFRYLICGHGVLEEELRLQVEEAGLTERVTLLGYREDIRELMYAADVFVFPSLQEGMPVALMEALATGLTVIASDIRGNRELVSMQKNAKLFSDIEDLKQLLQEAVLNVSEAQRVKEREETLTNIGNSLQAIDKYQVSLQMHKIYKEVDR